MKLKSLTRALALSLGAITLSASVAAAQPLLNFEGSARVSDPAGGGGATLFIDFLTAGSIQGPPAGTVTAIETITSPFTPEVTVGTVGVIQDVTVSAGGVVGLPISNFLVIGPYTFSVESAPAGNTFGPISLIQLPGTSSTLAAFGVFGTVSGGDFATPLAYQGIFTAQFANLTPAEVVAAIETGGTLPVSFSAEFAVVPEPATVVLLGTGIAGLGLFGLRRRNGMQA